MVISLTVAGRQCSRRRSSDVISASISKATIARINIAAKTPLLLKVPIAVWISKPIPWTDPRNSLTTAPTRAKLKLVCKLAMIHVRADGRITCVVSWRWLAPRMRALASRLRSTSRTPWKALKKTIKNTITTDSATFDWMPNPSPIMKIGPRTTRGIEFSALIYGPRTSDKKRYCPRTTPKMTPRTTPITKPMMVSSKVTATCSHNGPCAVPCVTHVTICVQIPLGCPQKKGSITPVRAPISQPPRMTTINNTRRTLTRTLRRRRVTEYDLSSLLSGAVVACSRTSLLSTFIANHHLIAQVFPDIVIQLDEARLKTDFRNITWARQVYRVDTLDGGRTSREDAHPVGQSNCLFQIVCDKDNGSG